MKEGMYAFCSLLGAVDVAWWASCGSGGGGGGGMVGTVLEFLGDDTRVRLALGNSPGAEVGIWKGYASSTMLVVLIVG